MIARAALVLLVGLRCASAFAQTPNNQISYAAVLKAKPGTWAEYVMSREGEEQQVRARYTLVRKDEKGVVLDIDSSTPIGRMVMRLDFVPDGANRYKLTKATMKMGDAPPRETPIPEGSTTHFGKDDSLGEPVGREAISVKAGKFTADHYRRKTEGWATEVWVDDSVAPVGLIRLTDAQGSRVELVATGKNGKGAF